MTFSLWQSKWASSQFTVILKIFTKIKFIATHRNYENAHKKVFGTLNVFTQCESADDFTQFQLEISTWNSITLDDKLFIRKIVYFPCIQEKFAWILKEVGNSFLTWSASTDSKLWISRTQLQRISRTQLMRGAAVEWEKVSTKPNERFACFIDIKKQLQLYFISHWIRNRLYLQTFQTFQASSKLEQTNEQFSPFKLRLAKLQNSIFKIGELS